MDSNMMHEEADLSPASETMDPSSAPEGVESAVVHAFSQSYPFPLDRFQLDAMQVYAEGKSVLLAAPTGTGKTILAEFAIWLALRENQRVFYTAPIKALSNQKYRDFRERYGNEFVGLMTGDIVENPTAPIVVMTTEIYRNVLLELERDDGTVATSEYAAPVASVATQNGLRKLDPQLERIACIIFDELHFMADPQRGPVWEECIIHSPPHVRFVGLSATVENARDLVAWLREVHGPAELIFHPERAVPLEDFYLTPDQSLALVRDATGKRVMRFNGVGGEAKRRSFRRWDRFEDEDENVLQPKIPEAPAPETVLLKLREAQLLPCLYFLPGRKAVEEAAQSCARVSLVSRDEESAIREDIERWLQNMADEDVALEQTQRLLGLLPLGIAYHHAGLLPALKMLVETLFANGALRAVFATDTLALGVNMPARSVVLGSLSKFDGTGMRLLTPNEYNQLTGRAGRRGKDSRGAAIILYSPWEEFEASFNQLTRPLLPVISAFSMRYNSVLNLWRPFQFERLRRVGAASFLEYQRRTKRTKKAKKQKKDSRISRERGQAIQEQTTDATPLQVVDLGGSVEHELIATTTVLRMFDYIDEQTDTLTLKGRLLRAIFHPAGLTLVEFMLSGQLDDLTSMELAEVVSWFVYDSDKPLWSADTLSERLKIARRSARTILEKVRRAEAKQMLPPGPVINDRFMGVAYGWGQGFSLAGLRQRISLAEGDILMVLNQTIDLLRQLETACAQILADQSLWSAESDLPYLERRELRQRIERYRAAFGLGARQLLRGTVAQSRSLPFRAAGLPLPHDIVSATEGAGVTDEPAV